jgi:hypothetical protein
MVRPLAFGITLLAGGLPVVVPPGFPRYHYLSLNAYIIADISINIRMFYLIGLGLCDEKDITIRGLEVRVVDCISQVRL